MRWLYGFLVFLYGLQGLVYGLDLVGGVQKTYRQNVRFHALFVQRTHIELLNKDVEEKGEMTFVQPGRFVIHYGGSQERKYICDGTTLWIYRPRSQEVEVHPDMKNILSHEALAFLGGLGEMDHEFKVKVEAGNWISLVPRDRRSPFKQIRLKIDPKTFWTVEVILFPRQGNESRYSFSDIQTAPQGAGDDFKFVPPPGTEVSTF